MTNITLPRELVERVVALLEYQNKPLCMCWAGCDECDPAKAPDDAAIYADLQSALKGTT